MIAGDHPPDEAPAHPSDARPSSDGLPGLIAVFAKAEFTAPVEAITGLVALLAEDTHDPELADYVEKLRAAARRLEEIVGRLLDPALAEPYWAGYGYEPENYSSVLRHELRTPITSILGYAELLIEEAGAGRDAFTGILADVIEAAQRLLGQIDAMAEFLAPGRDGQEPAVARFLEADDQFREPMEAIRAALHGPASAGPTTTGRILVVDDNASTLDLLSRRLRRDGHAIVTCDNGEGALALLEAPDFDLVLLDLFMPGLSGIEVLRALKERPETALLPVIIVSALDEVDSAVHCIEAGADDYLTKPINPVLLRARIAASLERKFLRDREQAITRELRAEQQKSEKLLRNVLPKSIIERLRRGETVIADRFDQATILFGDLVGFSALASRLPPSAVLDFLNRIFSRFDRLVAEHGLEKIKTIGDGYMAAGGLPRPQADHARRVADMALRMPGEVAAACRAFGHAVEIRIGLNTGPVAAGIIGQDRFIYDVWGDTVNVASRMEQSGEPGLVHVSGATRAALGPDYLFEERGPVAIKGREPMSTFFVRGRIAAVGAGAAA